MLQRPGVLLSRVYGGVVLLLFVAQIGCRHQCFPCSCNGQRSVLVSLCLQAGINRLQEDLEHRLYTEDCCSVADAVVDVVGVLRLDSTQRSMPSFMFIPCHRVSPWQSLSNCPLIGVTQLYVTNVQFGPILRI